MPLQTQVETNRAYGFPGTLGNDGPLRARSKILNTAGSDNLSESNIIGYACTYIPGTDEIAMGSANSGGANDAAFAGILYGPKEYALNGALGGGSALDPTLIIPDGVAGSVLYMGTVIVYSASGATDIGDPVYYNDLTGEITNVAGGGFTQIPNARVVDTFGTSADTLVKIELTQ